MRKTHQRILNSKGFNLSIPQITNLIKETYLDFIGDKRNIEPERAYIVDRLSSYAMGHELASDMIFDHLDLQPLGLSSEISPPFIDNLDEIPEIIPIPDSMMTELFNPNNVKRLLDILKISGPYAETAMMIALQDDSEPVFRTQLSNFQAHMEIKERQRLDPLIILCPSIQ